MGQNSMSGGTGLNGEGIFNVNTEHAEKRRARLIYVGLFGIGLIVRKESD